MQVEELLGLLRERQLDDEAIKALLSEAIASLEGPAEGEPAAMEEPGDEKMKEVFGI